MLYKEINFDDYRCRNIFVSALMKRIPDAKVYHKSHTSYQRVYIELPEDPMAEENLKEVKEIFNERREQFLEDVGWLLDALMEHTPIEKEDLSGEDYVKLNFPSPYGFLFLRHLLLRKGIDLKGHLTASTAMVWVYDEDEFNDKYWKKEFKTKTERLEQKIDYIAKQYMEEDTNDKD